MTKHLRLALLILLALAVGLPATAAAQDKDLPPADLNRVREGTVAPDFALEDLDGNGSRFPASAGRRK